MKKKLSILMLLAALIVPWASTAQTRTVTVGNWGGTVTTAYAGFCNYYKYSWAQTLYTQSDMGAAGWIQAIILDNRSTAANLTDSVKIYLGHTPMTTQATAAVSTWVPMDSLTLVWSRTNYTIPGEVGQMVIELDQPFYYDGTHTLAVVYSKAAQASSSNTKFGYTSVSASGKYSGSASTESYCRFPTVAGTNTASKLNIMFLMTPNQNDDYCLPLTGLHRVDATTSSATVAWDDATGASYEAGYAEVGGADNSTTITPVSVTDTFYTATGLSDNTEYWFYVRKLQGTAYSGWDSIKVRTLMTPLTIPLSYDFEDASDDADWAFNNAANGWYIGNLGQRRCMFVSNDNGLHNAYTLASSGYSWAWVDVTLTSGAYGINFDWRAQGESTWDYIRVFLVPDSVYLDATYATWGSSSTFSTSLPAGWISASTSPTGLHKLNLDSTWNHFSSEIYIPDSMAGTYHMAVLWVNDGSGGTQPPAAIDNISFDAITCYAPSACTVSDITPHEATLNITHDNATDFMCLYQMNGATHYDTVDITGSSYTFTGLQMGRIYNGIVYTLCNGDTSAGARSFTFTTTCGTLTDADLPYTEDFEAYGSGTGNPINPCWNKGVVAITGSGTTTTFPYPYSTAAINGTRGLYFYAATTSSTSYYNWLALPPIDETMNMSDLMVTFNLKRTATTSHQTKLVVGVTTNYTSTAGFVPVDTIDFSSAAISTVHSVEVSFANYTDTGRYILFYAPAPASATTYNAFYVDDITLRAIPTCFWPSSVSLDGVTSESADISWVPDARTLNPSGWVVEYGPAGFTPGNGTLSTETDTVITLTGLLPNTQYDVYISADCGSEVSDPAFLTFRTECVALDTLPYTQTFEGAETGSSTSHTFVECMHRLNNGTQYFGYPYVGSSTTYNHTNGGSKGLYWNASTTTGTYGDYHCVVLPAVDTNNYPINTLQVRFWAKSSATTTNPVFQVGVMTNPSDINTFHPVETVQVGGNTTWTEYTVALGTFTGEGQYVAIKAMRPSTAWTAYVDDITLELMPPCPALTDLEATTTVGSALLTWGWQAGYTAPDNYVVTYDSVGGTNPTTVNVTTNSTILTGLEANTTYKAYVQADCGSDGFGRLDSVTFTTGEFGCLGLSEIDYSNSTTGQSGCMAYSSWGNTAYQAIWTAAELTAAGVTAGPISGIDLGFTASTYAKEFTIFIGNTTTTSISSTTFEVPTAAMQVYGPAAHPTGTSGWQHYDFTTPFVWDGTSSIIITTFMNQPTGVSQTSSSGLTGYYVSASNKARYRYKDSNPFTLSDVASTGTAATTYSYRAAIHFYVGACTGTATCAEPAIMVTDATASTVDLAWAPGADETAWDVDYRLLGATTWTNAAMSIGTPNYTVTGLLDGTAYEFRVSFYCSADDTTYASTVNATTPCVPKTLPYTENFDNISTSTTAADNYGVMPMCWDYTLTGTSTYTTGTYLPGVYYGAAYAASGSYCLRLAGVGIFELPEVSAPLDSLRIMFSDTITSASYNGLVVGAMESGSFVPIDTVDLAIGVRNYIELPLRNYHGTSRTIALKNFYATSSTTYYSYQYIDDIVVDYIPACVHVENLAAANFSDTNITLSWVPAGQETEWDIFYGDTSIVVYDTFVTIGNLTPNTNYTFEVRSFCGVGDTSEAAVLAFRTPCAPQSLPYTEDFESYGSGSAQGISPCWVKGTNSATAYPYPSTTAPSGSRSLYFYGYHPSSASTTAIYSYAALPMFTDSVNHLSMSFKVRTYSTAQAYYTTYLLVGVMTDPHDISTFTGVDTINLFGASASSVHSFEVMFNNYTGNGQYIAIYDPVSPLFGTSTYNYSYAYVDDIYVDTIPSCPRPNGVTVNNITQNGATVHWSANLYDINTTFDIEYGPHGFIQGTGTTVNSSLDSVDLTGLNPSTMYDVYVRAQCSATDESPWSFVYSFNTICGPTALPMFFDPDNYSTGTTTPLPNCWTRTNNSTGSYNYYPYVYSSSSNAHTGNNILYYYFSTSSGYSTDELMAFPEIDVVNYPMNQVEVSFWAKASVTGKHMLVGVMTDPTNISTFQVVDTVALTTTSTEYNVELGNYTGNGAYVALRGVMEGTSSYYYYIDDITIGVMSHCPRAYNLTAYNGTATGATLAWTDTIGSTQWRIEYHAYGDTNITTVTANSNPFTLTGLTANTVYVYRVAPICSDGVQADWSRNSYTFSTSQVPATVPYTYDFENGTEWSNWQTISNNTVNWYRGNAVGNPGNAMYLSSDNGATRSWNLSAITNAAAYRDFDFGATPHTYELSFDALIGGSTDGNYDGITVMVVDPAIVPEASSTGLTSPWGHIGTVDVRMDTVWTGESVYLDGMQGVKRLVFFHFNQATASSHPYINSPDAIDNIAIAQEACDRPYDLAANNITDQTANLSWGGPATDSYVLAYRVYGQPASTNVYVNVTGNNYMLTGLTANTQYVFWAMHVCSVTATDTVTSDWSNGLRFSTECGTSTLPYIETFDSVAGTTYSTAGVLPDCWQAYSNGTNSVYMPHVVSSGSYWYSVNSSPSLTMTSGSAVYGDTKIVALPLFDAPVSSCGIRFYYKHENASYGTLEIGYVTSPDLAGTFHPLVALPATTTLTQIDSTLLSAAPANATRIALRWTHTASFYSVGIDNIEVWSNGPVCMAPVSLTASGVTYNAATVTWTGSDSTEVGIHEGLWDESGATMATVTNHTYTFTGLTPNTQYTIAARTLCEDNMTSNWVYTTITTDDLPCFAPTNIQVSNETTSGGKVTWTRGGDETEWVVNVFRTGVIDTNYTVINTPMCNVDGLYSDMSYTISVASVCGGIDTVWCDSTATLTTTACLPPTNVEAVANGHNAMVTWTSSGANEYHVLWYVEGFTTGADSVVVTNGTTNATITGLAQGESYDIYVYAYCDGQRSAQAGETHVTITGIDDVNSSLINLYPNPANTTVTVDGIQGEAIVTIVDMNGRTVFSEKAVGKLTIDLGGMAQGAYFVRITGENTTAIRKLIVK